MAPNPEFPEADKAADAIRELTAAKTEAEKRIADDIAELDKAKARLKAISAEPKTLENAAYLKAAKKAWRLSITACKSSIVAYQGDADIFQSEIDEILERIPEARQDN